MEDIIRVIGRKRYEECQQAGAVNQETLRNILKDNQDTAFGQKYGFASMKDADEYRARVPLHDYKDFEEAIREDADGTKHFLYSYPLIGYANTSGSSGGNKKLIPVTDHMLASYAQDPDLYIEKILEEKGGKRFHLSMFRTELFGSREGLVMMGFYYRNKWEQGLAKEETYVGGKELLFGADPGDVPFAKTYAVLLEEDVTVLETVFQYDFLHFFRYLESNWEFIVQTARSGKIPETIELSAPVRRRLESLPVREERLQKIEEECRKGFDGIAGRLWPKLCLLSGISSKAFFAEEKMMSRYVGDIPRYYFLYGSSEFYFGNPVAENDYGYVLMPRHNFFEFMPYSEEEPDADYTLLPEQLETGGLYEVIVTTYAGLYRYRTSDVVKIVGFVGESPVAEFVTRKGMGLNLVGEKITLAQLEQAIQDLEAAGTKVESYCFAADLQDVPGRYLAALEIATDKTPDTDILAEQIDASLKKQNWDYEDLRNLKELRPPKVLLFHPKEYRAFMKKNGLTGGHEKPKHIAPQGFTYES